MKIKGKEIRRLIRAEVLCLFFVLLTGCAYENKTIVKPMEERLISTDYLEGQTMDLPYFGLLLNGHFVLPITGSVTAIEPESYQRAVAVCNASGFEFWVKGSWENYISSLKLYRVKDAQVIWEQSYFDLTFFLRELPEQLLENELYLLRIILNHSGREFYYDLPFFYQSDSLFAQKLEEIVQEIDNYHRQDEKLMGTVALTVETAAADGSIKGRAKAVTAIRQSGGFEYLDKFYEFTMTADGQKTWQETIRNKKRGHYDKTRKSAVLSAGGQWDIDGGKFVQIEGSEVYAGNDQDIYTLYRRDEINDDYLVDELENLYFRGIGWKNNKYYFLGYGIFTDNLPKIGNHRGVAFFEWDGQNLNIPYFLEIREADLEEYLNRHLVVEEKEARIFWVQQDTYFILDLAGHTLHQGEIPLYARFDRELLLFYWQAQPDQKNQTVLWNNLVDEKTYTLYLEDKNQKIVGTGQAGIYVGEYQLTDTLEYLNREVVYPLQRLIQYLPDGREKNVLRAPTGKYFGLPVFAEKDRGILPILERRYGSQTHRGEIKVDYIKVEEQPFDFRQQISEDNQKQVISDGVGIYQDFYGFGMRVLNASPKKIVFGAQKTASLHWTELPEAGYYLIRSGRMVILAESLQQALVEAKEFSQYQIYYANGQTEKKLFDSKWEKREARISQFTAVKQYPELPRGCEVTALSMLLAYYDPKMPDRFQLAEELKEYSHQVMGERPSYQVDMKEAFAGSMFNSKEPGLGVYIEPISLIARRYFGSRVQNVTGVSFRQVLTFVSNGQPVQVINSDMAQAVPEVLTTTWHTANGYMEVTYREHSVVIVGFDDAFVYYADPLTGRIEKSSKFNFEAGFQSFGRQAMVITD
ncbi:hypothetical protein EII17_04985 [Clostridiales bacterium COT073_COT-073]|nr:hypothetical protein EII17_04985 [Clostridiales bacterium COT073_COT-073]